MTSFLFFTVFLRSKGTIQFVGRNSVRRFYRMKHVHPSFIFALIIAESIKYRSSAAPVVAASCGIHDSKVTLMKRAESERRAPFFAVMCRSSVQKGLFIAIVLMPPRVCPLCQGVCQTDIYHTDQPASTLISSAAFFRVWSIKHGKSCGSRFPAIPAVERGTRERQVYFSAGSCRNVDTGEIPQGGQTRPVGTPDVFRFLNAYGSIIHFMVL